MLHNSNPKAVSTAEKDGRYALHIACQNNASVDVVKLLINMYPDALSLKDKFGLLPIHFACSDDASMEVIKLLLRSAPNSIFQKDTRGWTALDYLELTRTDHDSILAAVTPRFVPQLVRSTSMPSRIDIATMFGKIEENEYMENDLDILISNPKEKKTNDPMTRRDIYQTYGFSQSARFINDDSNIDFSEIALPEII